MKVQYTKNHSTGKTGEIKEQSEDFANYLILKGVAIVVKGEYEAKEEKAGYETKEEKIELKTKVKGDGQIVEPKEVRVKNVSK